MSVGVRSDDENKNSSDSSESDTDACIESSFLRKIEEMDWLERTDFDNEDGLKTVLNNNK